MINRRSILQSAVAGLVGSQLPLLIRPLGAQEAQGNFSFDMVVERARAAAAEDYARPTLELTEPFADLTYDQYRGIRFRDEKRFFTDGDQGFQMDLLPPGFFFKDRVEMNLVRAGAAEPITFSPDYFHFHPDYFPYPDGQAPSALAAGLTFSGLRLRHPINRPGVWDEVAVFQGASYFRAVARDTLYGLSARGLAIGTAGQEPEEFPGFRSFWIYEPEPGARDLRLHALLDGPSISGAYDIEIFPGAETVMEIRAVLFPRVEIATIGIAPLTSMYFFGPERRAGVDDFRDAVHDSDGLMMFNGSGERLWRPLANPASVQVSAFHDTNPQAFGLIQRNRDFAHYEDAEAHYEQRPSAWIEPQGDWGPGHVMLIELPTGEEFSDNVVAFWRPELPLGEGSEQMLSYRLTWGARPAPDDPVARVIGTRSGLSILDARERVFVVDFDLGQITLGDIQPKIDATAGEIRGLSISPLPGGNFARVGFHFVAGEAGSSEFRLSLQGPAARVSETWLYRWTAA